MYAKELSARLKSKSLPMIVNFASPGIAFTNLNRHFKMPFWKMILLAPLAAVFVRTANQASQTILYAASSKETLGSNGQYFRHMKLETLKPPATDPVLSSKVYEMTIDAVHVDPLKRL